MELSMSQQETTTSLLSQDVHFEAGCDRKEVGEDACASTSDSPISPLSMDNFKMPERSGMRTPHKSYTVQYKLAVLDWYHTHGENKNQTAKHFGVDRKRIRDWLRHEPQFRKEPQSNMLKTRTSTGCPPHYQELDKAVLEWYKGQIVQGRKVTNPALRTKALELAPQFGFMDTFKASPNWALAWRRRNGDVLMEDTTTLPDNEVVSVVEEDMQQYDLNSGSDSANIADSITEALPDVQHVHAGMSGKDSTQKQNMREYEHWINLIQQTVDTLDNEFSVKMSQIRLLLEQLKSSIPPPTDMHKKAQSLPLSCPSETVTRGKRSRTTETNTAISSKRTRIL